MEKSEEMFTNVTYRNLDTGNVVFKNGKDWFDIKTRRRVFSYRVYRYVSLSSKIKQ